MEQEMARAKKDDATSGKTFTFMKPVTANERKTKTIGVRVEEQLLERFSNAASLAEKWDYELTLSQVVIKALEIACEQAEEFDRSMTAKNVDKATDGQTESKA